jgi:competence protein ComEC
VVHVALQLGVEGDGKLFVARQPRSYLLVMMAIAWATGAMAGHVLPFLWAWLIAATLAAGLSLVYWRRKLPRAMRAMLLLALGCTAAAWLIARYERTSTDDVRQYLAYPSQLARVRGHVDGEPYLNTPERGTFGRFVRYKAPTTLAFVQLDEIHVDGQWKPTTGGIVMKIEQADHRLQAGQRIEAVGWLTGTQEPMNPGEFDYQTWLARRGVYGRLTLKARTNWQALEGSRAGGAWPAFTARVAGVARSSLQLGMPDNAERNGLLDALLLGRRTSDMEQLNESFRQVGLSHLLSISGAHLTILLGIVWMFLRLVWPNPRGVAIMVLLLLAAYMCAVPPRVPIVRAAIMAGIFCAGYASGRSVRGMDMLALSALVVLIWRPIDVLNAGFQLSFVGVGALLLFATPLSHTFWPEPDVTQQGDRTLFKLARGLANYVAAAVVGTLASLPLVAFHFGILCPLAILLSLLAGVPFIFVIGLGFLKIIVGLLWPSGGMLLAYPLTWVTDVFSGLVSQGANWPGASIELSKPPTLLWTVAASLLVAAVLAGHFKKRRVVQTLAVALCAVWLSLPALIEPASANDIMSGDGMTLHMIAVGDGSCFVARWPQTDGSEFVVMFDCGSQEFMEVGVDSVVPALKELDIHHIDLLFISHSDMDHFCGVVDVADALPVGAVVTTPQLLHEAEHHDRTATSMLVRMLRQRGVPIVEASQGWSRQTDQVDMQLLWPPADYQPRWANDASIVLSLRYGPRRVLLNGDIQQLAMEQLLADESLDLKADVTDLPHHGSYVDASEAWLARVSPQVVLQSTGTQRLLRDKWAHAFEQSSMTRLVTEWHGLCTVHIEPQGEIVTQTFRKRQAP